jgi:hypothetical protein
MVEQYPHTMVVTTLNTEAVQDEQGNWLQSADDTTLLLPCRAEPNSYRFITLPDGSHYTFPFTVYLPDDTPDILQDAQITVRDIMQNIRNYDPFAQPPVEIPIAEDMAGSSTVLFPALKGKQYLLSKSGLGWYRKNEYTYVPDGGFTLVSGYEVQEGEVFFAFITGNDVPPEVDTARLVAQGTVKQFSRGQFNCRLWL